MGLQWDILHKPGVQHLQLRSRSKPCSLYLRFFFDTSPRAKDCILFVSQPPLVPFQLMPERPETPLFNQ